MTNKSNDDSQLAAAFYDANHSRIKTLLLLSAYLGDDLTEELVTWLLINHRIKGDPKNALAAFAVINANNQIPVDSTQSWHTDPAKVIDCAIFLCATDNGLFDLMIDRLTALAKLDDRSRIDLAKAVESLQAGRKGKPPKWDEGSCRRFVLEVDRLVREKGLSIEASLFDAAFFLRRTDGAQIDIGELTYDALKEIRDRTLAKMEI